MAQKRNLIRTKTGRTNFAEALDLTLKSCQENQINRMNYSLNTTMQPNSIAFHDLKRKQRLLPALSTSLEDTSNSLMKTLKLSRLKSIVQNTQERSVDNKLPIDSISLRSPSHNPKPLIPIQPSFSQKKEVFPPGKLTLLVDALLSIKKSETASLQKLLVQSSSRGEQSTIYSESLATRLQLAGYRVRTEDVDQLAKALQPNQNSSGTLTSEPLRVDVLCTALDIASKSPSFRHNLESLSSPASLQSALSEHITTQKDNLSTLTLQNRYSRHKGIVCKLLSDVGPLTEKEVHKRLEYLDLGERHIGDQTKHLFRHLYLTPALPSPPSQSPLYNFQPSSFYSTINEYNPSAHGQVIPILMVESEESGGD